MEKIKSINKKNEIVDYYTLENNLSTEDIPAIIDSLEMKGIFLTGFRLSNDEEQPFHFFRTFSSKKEFEAFSWYDVNINDFGVFCNFNNNNFSFTFDFDEDLVLTFSNGKIDLESCLYDFELYMVCSKSTIENFHHYLIYLIRKSS